MQKKNKRPVPAGQENTNTNSFHIYFNTRKDIKQLENEKILKNWRD
jgi:hypothetical protein